MNRSTNISERGSARLKFLVVVVVLGIIAYAGYLYIPVAYNAYLFKDLMHTQVDAAVALGHPPSWVEEQLRRSAGDYDVPPDAVITSTLQDKRMEVRVQFTRPIEFPGYTYQYEFDYTAKSGTFLTK
jgi:hypothetical protein